MSYWLMKSEPDVYSIEDLKRDGVTEWEGVRNYQARNFMMKDMMLDDLVLFYHSNAEPSGIAGVARVSRLAQPDPSSWNTRSPYFDEKSTPKNPRWYCVQVQFLEQFKNLIPLSELRNHPPLQDMTVLKKGQRLSVLPVQKSEFEFIQRLAHLSD